MVKQKLKKDGTKSRQGEGSSGRKPLKWNSPKELETYIEEYYKWAKDNNMKITVTGLAWWLNCSRQTLLNYETSEENEWLKRCNDKERRGYVDTIKKAKRFIEMNYENSLFNKSSTAGAIFTLKNNYDWTDKQEIIQTNNNDDLDNMTDEELKEQYNKITTKLEENDNKK